MNLVPKRTNNLFLYIVNQQVKNSYEYRRDHQQIKALTAILQFPPFILLYQEVLQKYHPL